VFLKAVLVQCGPSGACKCWSGGRRLSPTGSASCGCWGWEVGAPAWLLSAVRGCSHRAAWTCGQHRGLAPHLCLLVLAICTGARSEAGGN